MARRYNGRSRTGRPHLREGITLRKAAGHFCQGSGPDTVLLLSEQYRKTGLPASHGYPWTAYRLINRRASDGLQVIASGLRLHSTAALRLRSQLYNFQLQRPQPVVTGNGAAGSMTVKARVTNSGEWDADEIVQLYIRDRVGSITRPVKGA